MNAFKASVKRMLGDTRLGMIDYYRHPEFRATWNGPFNGQLRRGEMFTQVLEACAPQAIVETGTYRGVTTEHMAMLSGVPVYTVEHNDRFYGFSKARFWRSQNVNLFRGDSRSFLRELVRLAGFPNRILFYLDAHLGADLPLAEEIEIIFTACPGAIVMIDDFRVPWDEGYGFDDYGPGKALAPTYIATLVARFGLSQFYPSVSSGKETGKRRGCVVLAGAADIVAKLQGLSTLRQ